MGTMKYPSEIKIEADAQLNEFHRNTVQKELRDKLASNENEPYVVLGIGGALGGFLLDVFVIKWFSMTMIFLFPILGGGLGVGIAYYWAKGTEKDFQKRVDSATTSYREYQMSVDKWYRDYCKYFWDAADTECVRIQNNIQAQKRMGGGIKHPLAYLAELLSMVAKQEIQRIPITTYQTNDTITLCMDVTEVGISFCNRYYDYKSYNINPIPLGNGEKVAGLAVALANEVCRIDSSIHPTSIKEESKKIIVKLMYNKSNPHYIKPINV